jgi:hypothetical protein
METENRNNTPVKNKALPFPLVLIAVFLAYYTLMSMLAPSHKISELRKEYGKPRGDEEKLSPLILTDSAYLSMITERAFLQSRILMAGSDSIYLTINLSDSSMNLEISGVAVHSIRMKRFRASRILTRGHEDIITAMLASPLTIESDLSTIKKEPVMIKMAPKDTSEYKPDIMPDTSVTEPVNFILRMTNGINIYIYQDDNEKHADRLAAFRFDIIDRFRQAWNTMKSIAVLKVPEYHPYIRIKIPRADAKIVYRALPRNGQIGIYI